MTKTAHALNNFSISVQHQFFIEKQKVNLNHKQIVTVSQFIFIHFQG